jgi:hypothetical protein
MVIDISLTTKRMKFGDVWFVTIMYFIWCGVGKGTSGMAVFGVDDVVDCFSPEE